jgi:hypothetical protein
MSGFLASAGQVMRYDLVPHFSAGQVGQQLQVCSKHICWLYSQGENLVLFSLSRLKSTRAPRLLWMVREYVCMWLDCNL